MKFRNSTAPTHRAPGRARIEYSALAAPVGRSVGGAALLTAVAATGTIMGTPQAEAAGHIPGARTINPATLPGVATVAPANPQFTSQKLRQGDRGEAVRFLQERLNANGASIATDGIFGRATASAVRAAQSSAGLVVDAVVGPLTWGALSGTSASASAPATSTSKEPADFTSQKLRQGDRGAAVTYLQERLNANGASIATDGIFGRATDNAVRALQSNAKIGVDGVVGPKTWAALSSGASAAAPAAPSAPAQEETTDYASQKLRQGDRGAAVTYLQERLNANGASIATDGIFGRATDNAVRALQSNANIGVDGVVGPKTWAALANGTSAAGSAPAAPETRPTQPEASRGSDRSFPGDSIAAMARQQIGVRYTWGGNNPSQGFDCSGLVKYIYNAHGIDIARGSRDQTWGGRIIPQSEAQPGDLVAFSNNNWGHIGIYMGNGRIIDAPGRGRYVQERNIWSSPHVFVTYR